MENGRTRDEKYEASYRGNNTRGEGSFSGEGIFHGTLPGHKLEEIRTLSQEDYGSGGLVPQRLLYVRGLYRTDFVATWMF